ncbi:HBS1-like protein [Phalaenopsis equestris]|uniref:HBS1-like protein n=1 Tax=Phalaenopsis equestris TaxID=78828 RepID=UPI0009E40DC1|nr:HBS1-like protein [Phalaenopsis equestris]
MPRKTNYRPDYDEDYDDDYDIYDNYDGYDDNAHGLYTKGKTSQQDAKLNKPDLWSCSICSYDNDQDFLLCEICGVLRDPSVASGKASDAKAKPPASLPKGDQLFPSDSSIMHYNPSQLNELSEDRQIGNRTVSKAIQLNQNLGNNAKFNMETPQTLADDLDCLKLDTNVTKKKEDSLNDSKPRKGLLLDQEQGKKDQLNLAFVGHVDSGKSTLSGRLLHLLGRISNKEMHKYEKEAKEKGKGSFTYAWAMDESSEERERGVTMTVAVAYFDSKKYHVVLLDSPGHKDFVPNMISGATQADAAVLVVDASVGSFEAGMDGSGFGQTREHAQLIRSFGVEQLIVAVNKMDLIDYKKDRFDFIKVQLGSFLRSCGFKESCITWIPLSAMENQNLVTAASDSRLSSWYRGLCLLDVIDSLQPPLRDVSKPLRLPICDVTKLQTLGMVVVSGKLEAGVVQIGSKVLVMPSGEFATVRSIERDSSACNAVRAGDNVAISLQGIDPIQLMQGGVLCHPDFPVAVATRLELKIIVLDIKMPIIIGSPVEFHIQHVKEAARVVKIVSLLDQKTGKVSKGAPRVLKSKQSAIVEVDLDGAVCVEEFSRCKALGRAFLRSAGNTIAVGIVTKVFEQNA